MIICWKCGKNDDVKREKHVKIKCVDTSLAIVA